jgi:hypothetical protein
LRTAGDPRRPGRDAWRTLRGCDYWDRVSGARERSRSRWKGRSQSGVGAALAGCGAGVARQRRELAGKADKVGPGEGRAEGRAVSGRRRWFWAAKLGWADGWPVHRPDQAMSYGPCGVAGQSRPRRGSRPDMAGLVWSRAWAELG